MVELFITDSSVRVRAKKRRAATTRLRVEALDWLVGAI